MLVIYCHDHLSVHRTFRSAFLPLPILHTTFTDLPFNPFIEWKICFPLFGLYACTIQLLSTHNKSKATETKPLKRMAEMLMLSPHNHPFIYDQVK